jgi:hypothetical protein
VNGSQVHHCSHHTVESSAALQFGAGGEPRATAWALFIAIFAVTIIQLVGQRRWVHYD